MLRMGFFSVVPPQPALKAKSSFIALLMYSTLLGVAPSVTSARFRGRNKRKALHRESTKGGGPDAIVEAEEEEEEVEQSEGKEKTGELESATTATVSEKKDLLPETLEEEKETLMVVEKKTKSAKQRREGEVDDRNSDGFDAGRLSGGTIAAASVMAEHLVTDGQEGLSEFEVDDDDDPECVTAGPCLRCEQLELDADYCKETGRRQEVRCRPGDAPDAFGIVPQEGQVGVVGLPSSVQYRSCDHTEEDELQTLVQFWFSMVLLGVVACLGMRRRQKKIRSLYDQRAM